MDPWLTLLLGIALGALLGALGALVLVQRRGVQQRGTAASTTPAEDPAFLVARHQVALAELRSSEAAVSAILREELASVQATTDALREQLADAQRRAREFDERQRAETAARTQREQRESTVLQALAPVRESLSEMQKKVTELEAQRSVQHGELSQQLRNATESEERLRSTAETLASALRSNSTRGVWGETQLRSVVEAAGLIERVDFDVQSSISSDAGAGRPDMVVHLPGGKNIAVDAKVPFTAFLEASQIPATVFARIGVRRSRQPHSIWFETN